MRELRDSESILDGSGRLAEYSKGGIARQQKSEVLIVAVSHGLDRVPYESVVVDDQVELRYAGASGTDIGMGRTPWDLLRP
jgi:hypothetical protein